ncbi:MAG: ABC transporter ATP-binding protein [Lachnospiraceae bacterium]|nr:ABC transporter ATP-binding protein [Lachnospiraceae bacterium]
MLKKWLPQKKEYRWNFLMSILCSLVTSACLVVLPIILSHIINTIFYEYELYNFLRLLFIYTCVFLIYCCTDYFYTFNWQNLHNHYINKELKGKIFSEILHIDYKSYNKLKNGKLFSAVTSDADEVLYTIQYNYIQAISNFITMIIVLIILFSIDWIMGMLVICSGGLIVLNLKIQSKQTEECSNSLHQAKTIFSDWIRKFTKGIIDVKINFSSDLILKIANREVNNINLYEKKKMLLEGKNASVAYATQYIIKICIFLYLAILCSRDEIQIGAFYMVVNYIDRIHDCGKFLSDNFQMFGFRKSALRNINKIERKQEKSKSFERLEKIEKIRFKNVEYGKNDYIILHNLSCEFEAGKLAFVQGISGSGKTTMLNMIMKNIEPDKGMIFYNNCNINLVSPSWLRKQICYIKQDEQLFLNQSIKFNICLGKDIDLEKMKGFCEQLRFYEDIQKMKNGFETIINSENTVSDGQIQKILILRALFSSKHVYILDEITSHLDYESAAETIKLFKDNKKNDIVIFIAHDKNIYEMADVVYSI